MALPEATIAWFNAVRAGKLYIEPGERGVVGAAHAGTACREIHLQCCSAERDRIAFRSRHILDDVPRSLTKISMELSGGQANEHSMISPTPARMKPPIGECRA